MANYLRFAALLLAIVSWAFAAGSLVVAVTDGSQRWTMVVGAVLLGAIGAFFWWRFRSISRPRA